MPGLVELGKD